MNTNLNIKILLKQYVISKDYVSALNLIQNNE
jgi:hypothetical protein